MENAALFRNGQGLSVKDLNSPGNKTNRSIKLLKILLRKKIKNQIRVFRIRKSIH